MRLLTVIKLCLTLITDPVSEVSVPSVFSRNIHFSTNTIKTKMTILSKRLLLNKKYLVFIFVCNKIALGINYSRSMYKLLYKGQPNMHFLFYYLKEFNI